MSSSMNRFKNDFSIKFAQLMQERLPVWKKMQKEERSSLYSLPSIGGYLLVSLLGFIPGRNETNYNLNFHIFIAVICFIAAIILNIQTTNKKYQTRIKGTFFSELLHVFDKNIKYAKNRKIPSSYFENSKLYNHTIEIRTDDDIFYGNYKDVDFTINETDFGYETRDSKGRRHYHCMFKGAAMHFQMNKQIKSRVLIRSKTLLNFAPQNFEKVELESCDFAKKYNVFVEKNIAGGSGQIEARYLLNTAFMDRLMQIQTSFKVSKMDCSIYGNEMLVMLSTNKDLFEMNHLLGKIDDIKQYNHLFDEFASVLSFIEVLNLSSRTKL